MKSQCSRGHGREFSTGGIYDSGYVHVYLPCSCEIYLSGASLLNHWKLNALVFYVGKATAGRKSRPCEKLYLRMFG